MTLCDQVFGQRSGDSDFVVKRKVLIEYRGEAEHVIIPGDMGIKAIMSDAFFYSSEIKSITIPAEVENISITAFIWCNNLTSIIVDERNTAYSSSEGVLFNKDKTALVQYPLGREGAYTVPDGVLYIESFAFAGRNLTDIAIPASVSSIRVGAFNGCRSLANITVDERNTAYSSAGGVLFNKDGTVLAQYPAAREGDYTISDKVLHIADGAFATCLNLTAVSIPDSVVTIESRAFYLCESLTSITIPPGVASIGDGAFSNCKNLAYVTISPGVTIIGNGAFFLCERLTSVTIPASVTSIESIAFNMCGRLKTVTLSRHTRIGRDAFHDGVELIYSD